MIKEIMKNKKIKKAKLRPIQTPRAIELQYYKELTKLTNAMKKEVRENIIPLLKTNKVEVKDGISELMTALEIFRQKFSNVGMLAQRVSSEVVENVNRFSREKFMKNVNSTVGVDLQNVLNEEGLNDILALKKAGNKSLIKTIPEEFIKSIETVVTNGVSSGLGYKEIEGQILGIKNISSTFGKLDKRVKTIVRTEVASINANVNKARYQNAGITRAIWQTSGDERVRSCHKVRDGKEYDLEKGLYSSCDGKWLSVGQDFNCRCVAIPILE